MARFSLWGQDDWVFNEETGLPEAVSMPGWSSALSSPSLLQERPSEDPPQKGEGEKTQTWALHTQGTFLSQGYPPFPAAYTFPRTNSLSTGGQIRETLDLDLLAGVRLWEGAAFYADVEYYQGFGVNTTLGVAAFPSGEAYKVGSSPGYIWFPNVFFQQVIPLGDPRARIPPSLLQLGGTLPQPNVTFAVGRFWAGYFFDQNRYANDPRNQFMNWALVNTLAYDYAADSIGSTYGIVMEIRNSTWAFRVGDLITPLVPNGLAMNWSIFRAWQVPVEWEWDWKLAGHPGACRILGWVERSYAGKYAEAIAEAVATGTTPDLVLTRAYRYEYGVALSFDQECTDWLGVFLRLGWRTGDTEVMQFTDADRSLAGGISLNGSAWGRPQDTMGIGGFVDDLSSIHAEYLALGGLTFMIGDGALTHGPEGGGEIYYQAHIAGPLKLAVDYQGIANPGYNQDRGPVHLVALRLHFEY